MERLVEQCNAINLYSVQRGGIDSLAFAEWEPAEKVVEIMKPFFTAADHVLKQMIAALRNALSRRFSDIGSLAPFLAATLIDPRFKDIYFTVQEQSCCKQSDSRIWTFCILSKNRI